LTFWRQWHQQIRNRNWYLAVAAAILKNGNDVIFLQWVLGFGRNSVARCRMKCKLRKAIEIKTQFQFQYGGRLFFETRSCYISATNRYMLTIDVDEIWFVDKFWPSEGKDINKYETKRGRRMQGWYEKMTIFDQYLALSQKRLVRWAHAARQFVSIEFSLHPYNI